MENIPLEQPPKNVTCGTCGYLSSRDASTGEYHRVSPEHREIGEATGGGVGTFQAIPACLKQKEIFKRLAFNKAGELSGARDRAKSAFSALHLCDGWRLFDPKLSPLQHEEEERMENVEERQRRWSKELFDSEQRICDRRDAGNRTLAKQLAGIAGGIAIVLTVVQLAFARTCSSGSTGPQPALGIPASQPPHRRIHNPQGSDSP